MLLAISQAMFQFITAKADELKVVSLNVNGIGTVEKRTVVAGNYKDVDNIMGIQEPYIKGYGLAECMIGNEYEM